MTWGLTRGYVQCQRGSEWGMVGTVPEGFIRGICTVPDGLTRVMVSTDLEGLTRGRISTHIIVVSWGIHFSD